MKLTKTQLKQIIKEELNEVFGGMHEPQPGGERLDVGPSGLDKYERMTPELEETFGKYMQEEPVQWILQNYFYIDANEPKFPYGYSDPITPLGDPQPFPQELKYGFLERMDKRITDPRMRQNFENAPGRTLKHITYNVLLKLGLKMQDPERFPAPGTKHKRPLVWWADLKRRR